jgi:hypothetical protein
LATKANRPSALFTSDAHGVFLALEGSTPKALSECQKGSGYYYGAFTAPTSFAGLWAAGWTKGGTNLLTTESTLAFCAAGSCDADPTCDKGEDANLERDLAVASVHLQGDSIGVVYYVDVIPTLLPTASGGIAASVSAFLARIDFGASANMSGVQPAQAVGAPVVLSTQDTSAASGFRGPDHAAAAIIGDVVAIAWIEPTVDGSDQIRVQRYAMCVPK